MPFNTYDFRNHYEFKERVEQINYLNEELPDDIAITEYVVDKETGVAPVDFMAFKKREETISADQLFEDFLYKDYLIEIFGNAPILYRGLDIDFRRFTELYKNDVDIVLFSPERDESISPTLFFLSKIRTNIRRYIFIDKPEDIWKEVGSNGIVITTNPAIINSKTGDQKVVMLARPHNNDIETADYSGMNLQDFFKVIENEEEKKTIANEGFKSFLNQ